MASESKEQAGYVTVFAGSQLPGSADGENSQARMIKPYGLCAAPDGGLLIVDCYANLCRVSKDGQLTTRIGNADVLDQDGYPLGDYLNGTDRESFLSRPRFAAVTREGAVVFSDTGNNRVRVSYDGNVYLLAGSGEAGFQDGNYSQAQFDTPSGIAIAKDGTVFVADTLNHCIRAVSPNGKVSTFAGVPQQEGLKDGSLGEALFCEPNDIQLGSDGAIYVVDKGNQRIRRIANGQVTTYAGSGKEKDATTGYILGGYRDGEALEAQFQYPTGIFVDDEGVLYIADTGNNCIRMVTPEGVVTTVAGTKTPGNVGGTLDSARFNQPLDIYYSEGKLYISDSYNHVVRVAELSPLKEEN